MADNSSLRAVAPDRLPRLCDLDPGFGPDDDITFQLPVPLFGGIEQDWATARGTAPSDILRNAIEELGGETYLWDARGLCYGFPNHSYRQAFDLVCRLRDERNHCPFALITGFRHFEKVLSHPKQYAGTDEFINALWRGVKETEFEFARYLLRYTEVDPTVMRAR